MINYLWVDQYGNKFYAATRNELRKQIGMGGSRVSPMYVDTKDRGTLQIGYVVGQHWLTRYAPSPIREVAP